MLLREGGDGEKHANARRKECANHHLHPVQVTDLYGRGCVYYFSVSVARAASADARNSSWDVVSRSSRRRRSVVVGLDSGSRARRKADSVYSYDVGDLICHLRHKELTPEQKAAAQALERRSADGTAARRRRPRRRDEQYDATPLGWAETVR